jgi:hypothetical protein
MSVGRRRGLNSRPRRPFSSVHGMSSESVALRTEKPDDEDDDEDEELRPSDLCELHVQPAYPGGRQFVRSPTQEPTVSNDDRTPS